MVVRAVLFDLDGVLIDSRDVMRRALRDAWAEVGLPGGPDVGAYMRELGRPLPDIVDRLGWPRELVAPYQRSALRHAGAAACYDGVRLLLDQLSAAGSAVGVVTGKDGLRARSLLSRVGLSDLVQVVVGGDDTVHGKPHPQPVLEALSMLGARAEQAWVVGDMPVDLAAGRSAGCRVAAALWGYGSPRALGVVCPDLLAFRPADLACLVPDRATPR